MPLPRCLSAGLYPYRFDKRPKLPLVRRRVPIHGATCELPYKRSYVRIAGQLTLKSAFIVAAASPESPSSRCLVSAVGECLETRCHAEPGRSVRSG